MERSDSGSISISSVQRKNASVIAWVRNLSRDRLSPRPASGGRSGERFGPHPKAAPDKGGRKPGAGAPSARSLLPLQKEEVGEARRGGDRAQAATRRPREQPCVSGAAGRERSRSAQEPLRESALHPAGPPAAPPEPGWVGWRSPGRTLCPPEALVPTQRCRRGHRWAVSVSPWVALGWGQAVGARPGTATWW